jgi:hypothetical protein
VVSKGEKVTVKVLSVDTRAGRIALTMKGLSGERQQQQRGAGRKLAGGAAAARPPRAAPRLAAAPRRTQQPIQQPPGLSAPGGSGPMEPALLGGCQDRCKHRRAQALPAAPATQLTPMPPPSPPTHTLLPPGSGADAVVDDEDDVEEADGSLELEGFAYEAMDEEVSGEQQLGVRQLAAGSWGSLPSWCAAGAGAVQAVAAMRCLSASRRRAAWRPRPPSAQQAPERSSAPRPPAPAPAPRRGRRAGVRVGLWRRDAVPLAGDGHRQRGACGAVWRLCGVCVRGQDHPGPAAQLGDEGARRRGRHHDGR